ncbi:MAG TPA: asparagine synthase (glutamine-hydrolyzing) [Phycisphaerae bacterium]|nr:asparagine synthase (glutamine-hydrolyzing) [Phycisphaerae bacterium]
MCGIAGIIDFEGRPIDVRRLEEACQSLAHRGPDDRGIWQSQSNGWSVGLAHTRLAVIDPAPEAHQPMITPDGRWAIAYNGELYNYRALRDEIGSERRTASDTEVVLQACRAWGPKALERFDGMWAMAVVDAESRTGHLSRDPFGIKPLYHAFVDRKLVFASELRTLVGLLDQPLDIDPAAVACYLQLGYVPHPLTIYRQVRKLPPGHVLAFDARGPAEPHRYHFLKPPPTPAPDYAAACEQLRALIQDAVLRQCVADVPLGAFLSGGLDSSVVVACMARRQGSPIRTFSIGYADHARYDETHYARLVARHLGTEHHEFRLSFADILAAVEPMLDHLGEPFADSSLLPTSLVSRYTRQHVTVALSGDGGDELFGGYWRYLGHHYLDRYRRLPDAIRRPIEWLLQILPEARSTRRLDRLRQLRKLLRGDLPDPMDRHLAWARFLEADVAAELLGQDRAREATRIVGEAYREAVTSWYADNVPELEPLQRILLADLGVGLPDDMLCKVDTASMYHSLEVRVPLLSTDVVDFVTGLPLEYKIAGTTGKRILRDAFRDWLPETVIERTKMGFEVPVGEFFRNELRELFADAVTPDALAAFGINPQPALQAFDDHLHRRRDRTEHLWALLVLCWWRRKTRA